MLGLPYTTLDIGFDIVPGPGVNPYSARALSGTLAPIAAAAGPDKLARTVNGTLVDISAPQMRKYKLVVAGNDQAPPALDGMWVGVLVYVNCHVELAYRASTGSSSRPAVGGSTRVEGDYVYYRPQLTMRVIEYEVKRDEWGAQVSWSLDLEEV